MSQIENVVEYGIGQILESWAYELGSWDDLLEEYELDWEEVEPVITAKMKSLVLTFEEEKRNGI
jgi:hypothetical protein